METIPKMPAPMWETAKDITPEKVFDIAVSIAANTPASEARN